MSKRNTILAIIALVIILSVGGFLIYQKTKSTHPSSTVTNANPFGTPSGNAVEATTTIEEQGPTAYGTTGTKASLIHITGAPTAG